MNPTEPLDPEEPENPDDKDDDEDEPDGTTVDEEKFTPHQGDQSSGG